MVLNQFLYIIDAYSKAAGKGKLEEFANDEEEIILAKNMEKWEISYIPLK
jgi:hypothetical protein